MLVTRHAIGQASFVVVVVVGDDDDDDDDDVNSIEDEFEDDAVVTAPFDLRGFEEFDLVFQPD
jgi:hypothetical protein